MVLMCTLRWWEWENNFAQVSHLKSFWSSWLFSLKWWEWQNNFWQESHVKSFLHSWMVLIRTLRWWEWENDFPQVSHLNFFNHFLHIYSQITIIFTFKIFVMFMNCFDMNPKRSSLSNWFFRRATFHEWFWYDLSS